MNATCSQSRLQALATAATLPGSINTRRPFHKALTRISAFQKRPPVYALLPRLLVARTALAPLGRVGHLIRQALVLQLLHHAVHLVAGGLMPRQKYCASTAASLKPHPVLTFMLTQTSPKYFSKPCPGFFCFFIGERRIIEIFVAGSMLTIVYIAS